MKYMFASDIHGSAFWCEKLIKAYESEEPDRLVLLGDLLYHGPRNPLPDGYCPQKVCEMLNAISSKITAVRGNCDAEVDQMVLDFPIMADYAIIDTPFGSLFATHGHIYNDSFAPKGAKTVISGHTHIQRNEEKDGILWLNPGSVSMPKENSNHGYIIYDGKFQFKIL